ncbi:sulfurtransferase TusA family protein [Psychrosphaera aestuarii]|uniref:sulfurtransferase TusA family protein n=1 Tax=Psychrosphaera aestuarii TaxID=1266052 RepID=UPI001B33463F|nr:sulfurtransferase TusA family protein [Psychrosphaera aestuarii]
MKSSYQFDARGLTCPLAFVLVKQQMIKNNTKVFLLDDEITLYNFTSYLESQGVAFNKSVQDSIYKIKLLD